MASLDSLPADHRAVLQLVLQRGRSYDDIAELLSIDRAAVRERASSALDALGPQTGVTPERRALITDYLLGQLPSRVSEDTRNRLAESPGDRAWARVVASELAPLASGTLPEIPTETTRTETTRTGTARPEGPLGERPSSRTGGALLLIGGALLAVIVVVVLIVVLSSGDSSSSSSTTTITAASVPPATAPTPAATTGATPTAPTGTTATGTTNTTTTGTATAKPIAQVNLVSPTGAKTPAGVAIIVKQGANTGLVVRASGVPANTRQDAYAVWLYNSASDTKILGFVNPGVGTTQVLQTAGPLPAGASHFKQLLVSVETVPKPKAPGRIILQGALNLH